MNTAKWLEWIAATLSAVILATIFVFNTFQTKTEARETKQDLQMTISEMKKDIVKQLDRIEKKQDQLIGE
jgi:DNA-binding transcriptional regulator GbsR (MarR family)